LSIYVPNYVIKYVSKACDDKFFAIGKTFETQAWRNKYTFLNLKPQNRIILILTNRINLITDNSRLYTKL